MPTKEITIRFYIAKMESSDPPYPWGSSPVLRKHLSRTLPAVGHDGIRVSHDGVPHLIEVSEYNAPVVLHVQIARDLDEVPALRSALRTEPMHLNPGEVPASMSHLTFLPSGVVAIVRGTSSPGPHQCAAMISDASGVPFVLEALAREDQVLVLNNATGVSTLEFKATAISPRIAASDSVIEAARRLGGDLDFEVTIKLVARQAGGKRRLRTKARELIEYQRNGDLRLEHGKAKLVGAAAGRSGFVDLLEDQIVESRTIQIGMTQGQLATSLGARQVLDAVRSGYNDLLIVVGASLAATPSDFPE